MSHVTRRSLKTRNGVRAVEVREQGDGLVAVVDGQEVEFTFSAGTDLGTGREMLLAGPNGPERAIVARDGDTLHVFVRGTSHRFPLVQRKAGGGTEAEADQEPFAESPMTGVVLKMLAEVGATAKAGEPLFVIEAMKMEFVVEAPRDVVIETVDAAAGDRVDIGQKLVTFAAEASEKPAAEGAA